MALRHILHTALVIGLAAQLTACGGRSDTDVSETAQTPGEKPASLALSHDVADENAPTIWGIFGKADDPNTTVEVNKYIWQASLEVLNFLPIDSVDPFTGVIVTGYGRPPGGGKAYRATIYVQDPALDARSLKIAIQGQGGASVAPETVRAVENAILTRARQLRIRDGNL